MWKPFKYNMRLVIFLLLIQMGYIIAKAIENPHSCNDSPETDPRLKRSGEKEISFDSEDTTGTDLDDDAARKPFSKPNNDDNNDHNATDNDNEFESNSNTLPQKLPLVNEVTKLPANVEGRDITDRVTTIKDTPIEQPIYYKAIDPKYLIISGLSLPKLTKNITNVSNSDGSVNNELNETKTTPLDYLNVTKATNVSNTDGANDKVREEVVISDAKTDVSNIRELRKQLLDHLLDYFLNIIKEENFIRNDTRKKNGKDRMKVEEKLRNYYDPHHLDIFFDDDDVDEDDYYDTNLDPSDYRKSNDSEEDLLDNVIKNNEVNKENITDITPLTLEHNADKNTSEADTSLKDLQKKALNLEQNLNNTSPDGESLNDNLSEQSPVTSKYVNLIEKENDFSNAMLNATEKPEEVIDSNVNIITTTERYISNPALNEKLAEIDSDLLNYSEGAVTDRIQDVYDNSALVIDEYTSYEDYIDSEELEIVKNVTLQENDRNTIVITKDNGRRKNGLENEKYIANDTLNETNNNMNNSQTSDNTTSKDIASEREDKPKKLAIQDVTNKNNNENSPRNENDLAEIKNKNSSRNSKQGIKRKLRNNKKCGKLLNKLNHKKSNKHNCRKSIILNLNINLI